jgi:hypothetical protein
MVSMKQIWLTIIGLFLFAKPVLAIPLDDPGDRNLPDEPLLVTNFGDHGPGTLRARLEEACQEPGDDEIEFAWTSSEKIIVFLETPLEIPSDCEGSLVVSGLRQKETVLDGGGIESGEGILIVRSSGNVIRRLTLAGYGGGAGIVLEGNDNVIQQNKIGDRGGSCPAVRFPAGDPDDLPTFIREISHEIRKFPFWPVFGWLLEACGNGGAGIRIAGDRNLIGGEEIEEGNRILFNDGGGIIVEAGGFRNRFSKNVIAYNAGPGIELEGGANGGIEPLQDFRALAMEPEPAGTVFRYTLYGQGEPGTIVDLYQVAAEEEDDGDGRGEGARYLDSFAIGTGSFSYNLEHEDLPPGSRVSAVVCDDFGNCSEFSSNAALGWDLDQDGLLDPIEDLDGDGRIDPGESDPLSNDTDGDGLPDPLEDETDRRLPDTDQDGISDFVETGGDGNYDSADGDTNPLNPDTDGDGLLDGEEDTNHNGLIELGETDPKTPNFP